jgi:hypothetical protein
MKEWLTLRRPLCLPPVLEPIYLQQQRHHRPSPYHHRLGHFLQEIHVVKKLQDY